MHTALLKLLVRPGLLLQNMGARWQQLRSLFLPRRTGAVAEQLMKDYGWTSHNRFTLAVAAELLR